MNSLDPVALRTQDGTTNASFTLTTRLTALQAQLAQLDAVKADRTEALTARCAQLASLFDEMDEPVETGFTDVGAVLTEQRILDFDARITTGTRERDTMPKGVGMALQLCGADSRESARRD